MHVIKSSETKKRCPDRFKAFLDNADNRDHDRRKVNRLLYKPKQNLGDHAISIKLDGSVIDNHFGSQPIFGTQHMICVEQPSYCQ